MGAWSNSQYDAALKDVMEGPAVAASPGYFVLNIDRPNDRPEPVIAWKIGFLWTMPVTPLGYGQGEEAYVLHPDGRVFRHFPVWGGYIPDRWEAVEDWKTWVGENLGRTPAVSGDVPF